MTSSRLASPFSRGSLLLSILLFGPIAGAGDSPERDPEKAVIAHRGASGYLPEHTLEAYAFGYAQGADFIEPDLMLTRDGIPIALHDQTLDATTNVAEEFAGRAREDGRHYAIDFTLAEIKELAVRERVRAGGNTRTYPDRWPNTQRAIHFRVPTLAETIELVQGLNRSTGRDVGIYPEIKFSTWHAEQGYDFERAVLDVLAEYGYASAEDNVLVQSFEAECLIRLRGLGTELRLIQLIGGGRAYNRMVTAEGLDRIAEFANGIGPSVTRIFSSAGEPVSENFLVREAQARDLVVHPYTMRADSLPGWANSYEHLLERVLFEAGADGVFTDHPDLTLKFLRNRR